MISHDENNEVKRLHGKKHSLSCRSEKSSLPEIGNRSMHDHVSTVENIASDPNAQAVDSDEILVAHSR